MKRRTFCASALALASTFPLRQAFAAAGPTEIPIIRADGKQATVTASDVADLKGSLRGELIAPGQSGYDQARKLRRNAPGSVSRKPESQPAIR